MTGARIPIVEIESLDEFDSRLTGTTSISRWAIKSVDLRRRAEALSHVKVDGTLFLGCSMPTSLEDDLTNRGALVFPAMQHVPFNPYRAGLYTATELYDALSKPHSTSYAKTLDGRVFAWYTAQGHTPPLPSALAMSLHDQAISDALDDWLAGVDTLRLVGVMGGHATSRDDDAYRIAATLGGELTRGGFTVATGGGPGAMEAVNLGARLAHADAALLDDALARLAAVPDFHGNVTAWAKVALEVLAECPAPPATIGIPTWFYGHEPPNAFATHIAKYFSNALREDVLLSRCQGGLIILPGAAGTVQEVFQSATRNYYAAHADLITPVVLVGKKHWTQSLPVWGLLQALGDGRDMSTQIHLVDTAEEAIGVLAPRAC